MPSKTTKAAKRYSIDGKTFKWTTDEGAEVTIPLRVKMKVLREMGDADGQDANVMFDMIEAVAPGQGDVIGEQDANDFMQMFETWQKEYFALNGATPGE